jgi:hypothetical protein
LNCLRFKEQINSDHRTLELITFSIVCSKYYPKTHTAGGIEMKIEGLAGLAAVALAEWRDQQTPARATTAWAASASIVMDSPVYPPKDDLMFDVLGLR